MAEKKWSDYWGKYKSPSSQKKSFKPKTSQVKTEKPATKIPATKTPNNYPQPKTPNLYKQESSSSVNLKSIFMVILALGIISLGFWQFQTSKSLQVLEGNKTELECQLGNCTEQLGSINASLSSCASSLGICN
ncbi:MAG: DUF908 domain-containing protein, partial [Candidatus Aenigmarchaeota archaeon]|nr:DUF908 domain-containing protein [Candidatus Aenigmarchaeota archaeon]